MKNEERNDVCIICKIPIHEANLHIVEGRPFHYLCWERFEQDFNKKVKAEIKKRRPIMWLKAILISIPLTILLWWGILEGLRRIINIWIGV